jgi:hypothetical protein
MEHHLISTINFYAAVVATLKAFDEICTTSSSAKKLTSFKTQCNEWEALLVADIRRLQGVKATLDATITAYIKRSSERQKQLCLALEGTVMSLNQDNDRRFVYINKQHHLTFVSPIVRDAAQAALMSLLCKMRQEPPYNTFGLWYKAKVIQCFKQYDVLFGENELFCSEGKGKDDMW